MPYPGLDITAGVLPFFGRFGATCAGAGGSGADTLCLLVRRDDEVFAGSGSGSGDGAGALRFREEVGGREDEAATGAAGAAEEPDMVSDGLATFLAAALLVILLVDIR